MDTAFFFVIIENEGRHEATPQAITHLPIHIGLFSVPAPLFASLQMAGFFIAAPPSARVPSIRIPEKIREKLEPLSSRRQPAFVSNQHHASLLEA
jgi:hypothetical protein